MPLVLPGLRKSTEAEGILNVNVNFGAEKAQVKYDADKVKLKDIIDKIVRPAMMYPGWELKISMTCAACSTRVEQGLNKMDGILEPMLI